MKKKKDKHAKEARHVYREKTAEINKEIKKGFVAKKQTRRQYSTAQKMEAMKLQQEGLAKKQERMHDISEKKAKLLERRQDRTSEHKKHSLFWLLVIVIIIIILVYVVFRWIS